VLVPRLCLGTHEIQALPANHEAEPRGECVPKRSPWNEVNEPIDRRKKRGPENVREIALACFPDLRCEQSNYLALWGRRRNDWGVRIRRFFYFISFLFAFAFDLISLLFALAFDGVSLLFAFAFNSVSLSFGCIRSGTTESIATSCITDFFSRVLRGIAHLIGCLL
jgi:hypothetical protein